MKKYFSFFRLRFLMGMQYRTAAIAGVMTQFVWGFMEILMFRAFYRTDAGAFPMSFDALVSYVWMQQAFLSLFMMWILEQDIFESIKSGNIAYELCRPIHIYDMWFSRSLANRMAQALLRCVPIFTVTIFLPEPFTMKWLPNAEHICLFAVTMVLSVLVTVSACNLMYVLTMFTISPDGVRMVFVCSAEFLSGGIIPLPFLPDYLERILRYTPFAAMQNVPLRIYSMDLYGEEMIEAVLLQIFWLVALTALGRGLSMLAARRITVQGG